MFLFNLINNNSVLNFYNIHVSCPEYFTNHLAKVKRLSYKLCQNF